VNNNTIRSLWIGELTKLEILAIKSFLANGHKFELYCYEDIQGVPEGTILIDANEIIPKDKIWTYDNGSLAGFSNNFRYNLLYEKGGWWVDMDTICLKPFDFDSDYVFSTEKEKHDAYHINLAALKITPKHKLMGELLDGSMKNNSLTWGSTGPSFLRGIVNANKDYNKLYLDNRKAPHVFCPISYQKSTIIISNPFAFKEETYAVHLWNEIWRRNKWDKNKIYPPESLYEALKKKYSV